MTNPAISTIINISHAEQVSTDTIAQFYQADKLQTIISTTLDDMLARVNNNTKLVFPYFANLNTVNFQKQIEIDIYITDLVEGRKLNKDARGKDYATNILSYPSNLPAQVLKVLPSIPLGELIICHDVVARQAKEQGKTITNHLHHLLVHGILHLLGFDHELGETERQQMESFEIDILSKLNIANPYE